MVALVIIQPAGVRTDVGFCLNLGYYMSCAADNRLARRVPVLAKRVTCPQRVNLCGVVVRPLVHLVDGGLKNLRTRAFSSFHGLTVQVSHSLCC